MTYEVNFTDPDKLPIVIPSRAVNTTSTDVALFGYTNLEYGEPLNETFLHLLENFATPARGTSVAEFNKPSLDPVLNKFIRNPIEGQYWFNKTRNSLMVYHSGAWREIMMGSHIAANWGIVTNGQSIPRPVNRFGYSFPYSECTWSIAPRSFEARPDWYVCLTDNNGVVTSRMRQEGAIDQIAIPANYLILGVRHNTNLGTVRAAPCPPASVAVGRRLPAANTQTVQTTDYIDFDLEAVPGTGTQGPITYQWAIANPGNIWQISMNNTTLTDRRIIGRIEKTDKTTTAQQTCAFTITITDGCGQTRATTYTYTADFTLRPLPAVTVTNCSRTLPVNVNAAATVNVSNSLTVARPAGATWEVDWDTANITHTGTGISHTVTADTADTLTLSFAVQGTTDASLVYTIPYRIRDVVTGVQSSLLTCTTTINRNVIVTTSTPLGVSYPCITGRQIGNAGGGAVAVTTPAGTAVGGAGGYSFAFNAAAPGGGFNVTTCSGAGIVFSGQSVNPTTGVVSFNATPPGAGSGDCVVSISVEVTDSNGDTATAAIAQRLRWGAPADNVVTTAATTCPGPVTIMTAQASAASRTATITIPVTVRDQASAVMTSGYVLDWEMTNGCGDVAFSALSGSVNASGSTATNISFTATASQNASFNCPGVQLRITVRNTTNTWSTCTILQTCTITIIADSTVQVPLSLSYNSGASQTVVTCQSCDGTPCGATATVVATISGGVAPYTLLPQSPTGLQNNGWTITGNTCAADQQTVTVGISGGNVVTATLLHTSGTTAATCDGTITLRVRDAANATAEVAVPYSLIRTVCIPACVSARQATSAEPACTGMWYVHGVMAATTPAGTPLTAFGSLVVQYDGCGDYTPGGPNSPSSLTATSYANTGTRNLNFNTFQGQRYNAHPAVSLHVRVTVPGVGYTDVPVIAIAPTNNATSSTVHNYPFTVAGRSYSLVVNLTCTLISMTSSNRRWTIASSWSVAPAIAQCASSGSGQNIGGGGTGPIGGGGGCFTEDMLVQMADGSTKRIVDVEEGDVVRSFALPNLISEKDPSWRTWTAENLDGSSFSTSVVIGKKRFEQTHHYVINGWLKGTEEHPLLVLRDGVWAWMNIQHIRVTDKLLTNTRDVVEIHSIGRVEAPTPVVLIDVDNNDSYFVLPPAGGAGILAHNAKTIENGIYEQQM